MSFPVYIIGGVKTCISLVILFTSAVSAQTPNRCDRSCMTGLVDQYLAAMVKHDPSGLPLAKACDNREHGRDSGRRRPMGRASEAPTTFKIDAVDPASSQVAFYGVMKEWDKPLIIAMRLKVINGKITEIEHVLARNMRHDRMQNLITPRPGLGRR